MKQLWRSLAGAYRLRCFLRCLFWICTLTLTFQFASPRSWAADALGTIIDIDIQANTSLEDALIEWGEKSGVTVMINTLMVNNRTTQGVRGTLNAGAALSELLRGSGLSYTIDGNRVRVVPSKPFIRSEQREEQTQPPPTQLYDDTNALSNNQSAALSTDEAAAPESNIETSQRELAQVVVTAQKRTELLQDVPVPVTAINAETLIDSNQLRLQDYYITIPGLSMVPADARGAPVLAIRGLTSNPGNPTVGVMVDDVPYGSSTANAGGFLAPDFDPSDLARVEELRGPQGTLYGADSLGGLLKFVTVDPSPDALSGRVQVGTSSVHNGAELGYNVRGAVNVPLNETLAIRASAYTRIDPGYIDNPTLGIDGVNRTDAAGGRLSALWRPSEAFSLKLTAMLQRSTRDGTSNVDLTPGLTDLQQSDLRGTGWAHTSVQVYSATMTTQMSGVDIVAISGYNTNTFSDAIDLSQPAFASTVVTEGLSNNESLRTNKFSQELRFSSHLGQHFEWLLGAFYTHENSPSTTDILQVNSATGVSDGNLLHDSTFLKFSEYAAFTDLTFHITDRFDIQAGGRESKNTQSLVDQQQGPFASPYVNARSSDDSFTYLVTPRFKLSPNLMLYARLASGYRPGGFNETVAGAPVPLTYAPDKTANYEIGTKGSLLDQAFSFDASVYYIRWKNFQNLETPPGGAFPYFDNPGNAKSQGVELTVNLQPIKDLRISAWVSWNDAVLVNAFPATSASYGTPDDRLPYSSRFSGNMSVSQDISLARNVTGFVVGTLSYVGNRMGVFTASSERAEFPAYARTDMRTGVKYNSWTADLFVTNLSDKRGVLSGGAGTQTPGAYYYIQPRTIGLSLWKLF